jgi:hypothetical protein
MIVTFSPTDDSRALARLADEVSANLSGWGYATLLVDWHFTDAAQARGGGLAALVSAYRSGAASAEFVEHVEALAGVRDVLPAGPTRLVPPDPRGWARAYRQGLADFLDSRADEWRGSYDVVVMAGSDDVASRGIQVAHLPDVVVLGYSAGTVDHAVELLRSADLERDRLPYGRGRLVVVPLPTDGDFSNLPRFESWLRAWVSRDIPLTSAVERLGTAEGLAALLAHRMAGTALLGRDPEFYLAAAAARDGIVEAARAIRPYLSTLVGDDPVSLDARLVPLLRAVPDSVSELFAVLTERTATRTWTQDLVEDPFYRPIEALPVRGGREAVRHACPVDGNYVWYRERDEPVPNCPDHPDVTLVSRPGPREGHRTR